MGRAYRIRGDALSYRRVRRHMTQKQLGEKAGVSYATISRIENGEITTPRFSTIEQLASALDIEADELIEFPPPPDS